jgi:hypothetical protein
VINFPAPDVKRPFPKKETVFLLLEKMEKNIFLPEVPPLFFYPGKRAYFLPGRGYNFLPAI